MLYFWLKIFHILSAGMLFASIAACFLSWRNIVAGIESLVLSRRIQLLTIGVIVPISFLQLATGFTMMSVQHEDMKQLWVLGSLVGFIFALTSWLGFAYSVERFSPKISAWLLGTSVVSLMTMVFFMTSKVSG